MKKLLEPDFQLEALIAISTGSLAMAKAALNIEKLCEPNHVHPIYPKSTTRLLKEGGMGRLSASRPLS